MTKITLKPGDYVSTKGMTEEQYHAVAKAFMAAGAKQGEYKRYFLSVAPCFGWMTTTAGLHFEISNWFTRRLTVEQVLSARSGPIEDLRTARKERDEAETAYQVALEAVRAELGDGFTLLDSVGPQEDMSDPANWREGDVVECIDDNPAYCHEGGLYIVNRGVEEDRLSIKADDDGDLGVPPLSSFRFHHRPQ